MDYRMVVEYRGTDFHGFQRQGEGIRTVQGSLEEALTRITGTPIIVRGAGRTDAGVHARGQVVGFELPEECDVKSATRSLNGLLAPDIAVRDLAKAPVGFDPRRDAAWREYRYLVLTCEHPSALLREYSYHYPLALDGEKIAAGAMLLIGVHDLSGFCCQSEGMDCTREILLCEWERAWGDLYWLRIRANAFVYKMARVVTGALVKIGAGQMSLDELEKNLQGAKEPCCDPLPPQGLFLWEVGVKPQA